MRMIMWDEWKPIASAPSDTHILLGWSDGGQAARNLGYDFLFDAGSLHDGRWLAGPVQPDWWMEGPPPPPSEPSP
jgi:hypothetical protein